MITTSEIPSHISQKLRALSELIGNTPLAEIRYIFRGKPRTIYAKLEWYNFTGSIKDRMALHILRRAYETGAIHEGNKIIEATSGNTGIAFSAIGRALGHPVKIIMPNWLSRERIDIIRALGAEIELVSKEEGGFLGSIQRSKNEAAANSGIFLPCQFTNTHNCEAHEESTGREIIAQLATVGKTPDAFVAGVGTGGTVMGVAQYFRQHAPAAKVHPLEPAESPTLRTGHKVGHHRIQGISDEFIPEICKLHQLDEIIDANDGDAILMAQKISQQLGMAVGISSGANFIGALKAQELHGENTTVVTIFCDSNKKYLSTDLMKNEPIQPGYLSSEIEFTGFSVLPRVSRT